jgi:hypothetical protein
MGTLKWTLIIGFYMALFYAWGWLMMQSINHITDEFAKKVAYEEQRQKCETIVDDCIQHDKGPQCIEKYDECVRILKRMGQ